MERGAPNSHFQNYSEQATRRWPRRRAARGKGVDAMQGEPGRGTVEPLDWSPRTRRVGEGRRILVPKELRDGRDIARE